MSIMRVTNLPELEEKTSAVKYCREALSLDLPDVTGLAVTIPCPFQHTHDSDAKLIVYRNGRIRCSSHKKTMTIWDLAMQAEGLNFRESVQRVCEFFGIEDLIRQG